MRIGFDVSQTAEEKAGCGYVADQLIRSLVELDGKNEYLLYPTFYSYRNPAFQESTRPVAENCSRHFEKMSFKEMKKGWDSQVADRTAWLGSPDIVHCNNFSCIKDHGARIVYTLYDLTPFICPQFLTEPNRLVCSEGLFNAGMYADSCIAISESTKKDFLHFFPHYPEERITVIPLGTRPGIEPVQDPDIKRKVMEKYKIKGDFWFSVGTVEPRKNYKLLIDAFSKLQDGKYLAIAGGKGWLESDIGKKLKRSGIGSKIKFLGYVPDKDLSALYSSCFAFVYPSFYEGFGLPVLEAMSCGAAVICGSTGSLREVGGEAARYIDPTSEKDLLEQMSYLGDNPGKRSECRAKALEQVKKFTWEKAARIVLDVYEKTLKNAPYFSARKKRSMGGKMSRNNFVALKRLCRRSKTDEQSVFFITLHKTASSLFSRYILKKVKGLDHIDYEARIFSGNKDADIVFRENGYIYGSLRLITNPAAEAFKIMEIITEAGFIDDKKCIFMVRDPRDIIISSYYSFGFSHSLSSDEEIRQKQLKNKEKIQQRTIDEFAPWYTPLVVERFDLMSRLMSRCREHILLRYEDMVENYDHFYDTLSGFVSLKRPVKKKLHALTRPAETEDVTKHKRSGKVGGYKEKLEPATVADLNNRLKDILSKYDYPY